MVMLQPGINLFGQTLNGETFTGDGTGGNLSKITAQNAIFDKTILVNANLREADLFNTSAIGTELSGAALTLIKAQQLNLTDSTLINTTFYQVAKDRD